MTDAIEWSRLERLEEAIAWRREPENAPLANFWNIESLADLASKIRRLLTRSELDERLIALLWQHVPGDDRSAVVDEIEAPGTRYVNGADRLSAILNTRR